MYLPHNIIWAMILITTWPLVALTSSYTEDIGSKVDHNSKTPYITSRQRRDGYGGYNGGGYGGSYGCHCPYQSCDNSGDLLLYFSAGALLGLLFSMLQPQALMAVTNGRKLQADNSTGSIFFTYLPTLLSQDIGPVALDVANIYYRSQKEPQCSQRWLCEFAQNSSQGGLRSHLISLTG